MESISPLYPPAQSTEEQGSKPGPPSKPQPITSCDCQVRAVGGASISASELPGCGAFPSHQAQTPGPALERETFHLYSPTRAEIESHHIRQRLSLAKEDISSGLGSAPEPSRASQHFLFENERNGWPASAGEEQCEAHLFATDMADTQVKEGDAVSYNWGSGQPGGTVTEVSTDGPVQMETKSGNTVEKKGDSENPALYIERSGHDVVKKASEVEVDEKGDGHKEEKDNDKKENGEEKKEENGEPQTGEKRAAEETAEEKKEEENGDDSKKQKTDNEPKENGEKSAAPKKKGRPAKNANGTAASKPAKKREPKKAATESGEPRRSGRVASKSS